MTTLPRPPRPCIQCRAPHSNDGARCDACLPTATKQHNDNTQHYRTPQWRRLRKYILARDYNACVSCGGEFRLALHHITPRADGGTDQSTNLVTLCHYCHKRAERGALTAEIAQYMAIIANH